MNQLHSELRTASVTPLASCRSTISTSSPRLVVVIRQVEEDVLLAGRIRELARERSLPVLLVGIAPDASREAELRRSLITIAAFLREGDSRKDLGLHRAAESSTAEIQIEHGRDWLSKVRALLQPDDVLACYSEQQSSFLERPLSDVLSCGLNLPIYTFAGLQADQLRGRKALIQAASWTGSLVSIAAFLILQARIVMAVQGWLQSTLLLIALLAEVGVVWFVNSLIAQI